MTILVTQEHVDRGARQDCWECPIALALADATGRTWTVRPDFLEDRRDGKRYGVSEDVFEFMGDFDSGDPVEPFSFELETHE